MLEPPKLSEAPVARSLPTQDSVSLWRKILFVLAIWLVSRAIIIFVLQVVAPLLPLTVWNHRLTPVGLTLPFTPSPGWELFTHWDGKWYEMIATRGFEYGADYTTKRYSISFPPMFSLISYGVMTLFHLPFAIAGTLVNNAAFLGALILLYLWVEQQHGAKVARWSAIALAWCPYSLSGTVAYTEGLYLLTTTAAMYCFERKRYFWATISGAIATLTRFFGTALIPALLVVAWRQKRSAIAYISALGIGIGWVLFLAYCGWKFNDPLAPFRSQAPWNVGKETWKDIFAILILQRQRYLDALLKVIMFFGGAGLLWAMRKQLSLIQLMYGFCYIGVVFIANSTDEMTRYAYANVILSIALGLFLAAHPRWRIGILGLFLIKMIEITVRFAWWHTAV